MDGDLRTGRIWLGVLEGMVEGLEVVIVWRWRWIRIRRGSIWFVYRKKKSFFYDRMTSGFSLPVFWKFGFLC